MSKRPVLLDAPRLGTVEKEYLARAIESGYVSTVGPFVPEFEKKFSAFVGADYAVAVQSGTAALHVALHEMKIGPGDEVIIPAITFIATANAVLYTGAKPVIVDIDPFHWNISAKSIIPALTAKTKAIMPVHLYGNPCPMEEIQRVAEDNHLYIIEDATESLGSYYKGQHTGTFGEIGCFSFNGNKLITTGGGGMIVTNDRKRAEHIKFLVNQARSAGDYYHTELGFNYRMTNIEAALGLAQLNQINEFIKVKQLFSDIYRKAFADFSYVRHQQPIDGSFPCWWLNCASFEKMDIAALIDYLNKCHVQTRRIFTPLSKIPYLIHHAQACPMADKIYAEGICLPSSPCNTVDDIQCVVTCIQNYLKAQSDNL